MRRSNRNTLTSINLRFLGDDRAVVARSSNTLALHEGENGAGAGAGGGTDAGAAGGDGKITVMPNGNTVGALSAVERATNEARARIAAGGSALPPGNAVVDDQAKPVVKAGEDGKEPVRASDGTFAEKSPAEVEAERQRRAAEDAAKTPEQRAADKKAADDAEAARVAALTPEQRAEEAKVAERTVEIALEDGALPVEFDDPAIAAAVRDRFEIAAQAEQMIAQAQTQLDDVIAVRESVNVDPVGFVLSELKGNVEGQRHLVLSLVSQDTPEAAELRAQIAKLAADPNELRAVRGEQKGARAEYANEATTRIAEARAVETNLKDVRVACAAMLPRDMTPEKQRVAFADMLRDVQAYAIRHDLTTIEVQDIPLLLQNRLIALGVDPLDAAQQANEAVAARRTGRKAAPRSARNGTTAAATARAVAGAPAGKTGSSFVAADQRRRAVAVPGGGAGSPSAGADDLTPPLNPDGTKMTSEQTIAWHRGRLAKGIRSF